MTDTIISNDPKELSRLRLITFRESLAANDFAEESYAHNLNKIPAIDGFYTTSTISNNRMIPAHGAGVFQTDEDTDNVLCTFTIDSVNLNITIINYDLTNSKDITAYFIINGDIVAY